MEEEIKKVTTSDTEEHEEDLKEIVAKYMPDLYEKGHIATIFYHMLDFAENFAGTNGIRESLAFYYGFYEIRKLRIAIPRNVYEDIVDFMKFLEETYILNYTDLPDYLRKTAHYCDEILRLDDPDGEDDLVFYLAWLHSSMETDVEDFVQSRLGYLME